MVRRTKIIVLAVAVTLTHWLGCAGENEQNYKLLDDDKPILQQDHDRRGSNASPRSTGWLSSASAQSPATQPAPKAATPPPAGTSTAVISSTTSPAFGTATYPPGTMMFDRRDWPRIQVTAADGLTTHFPVYFTDPPLKSSCNCDKGGFENKDIEAQAKMAMCGSGPNYTPKEDLRDAAKQPVKAALDLIFLPVHMLQTGPASKTVTTP